MAKKKAAKKPTVKITPEPTYLTIPRLINLQKRLDLIHDVISTVVCALVTENAEHGPDFAHMLKVYGMDALYGVIEDLDQITGHYGMEKDDEDESSGGS